MNTAMAASHPWNAAANAADRLAIMPLLRELRPGDGLWVTMQAQGSIDLNSAMRAFSLAPGPDGLIDHDQIALLSEWIDLTGVQCTLHLWGDHDRYAAAMWVFGSRPSAGAARFAARWLPVLH